MTRRQSLTIITLMVFCFLSKIHAQEYETDYEFVCPCENGGKCSSVESIDSYVCECPVGFEGENCAVNICDLPDAYHCENVDRLCIKPDKICDGNNDCPSEEDETLVCQDTGECIGPIRWCDGKNDCSNNDDEIECCHGSPEQPKTCEEGKFLSECDQKCVLKCDGKNDNCVKLHGKNAHETTCIEFTDLDEQGCPTSCSNDTEIQCFSSNNPLPFTCLSPEKKCDGIQDCKTFGEDEQGCPTECPFDQWTCWNEGKIPIECVESDAVCNTEQDCNDGSDEIGCECSECTCTDENGFLSKCLSSEDEECPNETDEKSCRGSLWWIWLIVVLILLLILALLIWYFCRDKCRKKKDPYKDPLSNQDAGSEESQPMQPGLEETGDCNPVPSPIKVQNGTISPTTPSPRIEIPPESQKNPSPPPPPPDFDWEQAAQRIVKDHRKNTAHIHIPPENGFLMTEFPKDRIHEERSVSPQPAPVPTAVQNAGPKINYPQNLDRQVSETGEVVRYAGPTRLPVHAKGKKSASKTPFNYADPKDH